MMFLEKDLPVIGQRAYLDPFSRRLLERAETEMLKRVGEQKPFPWTSPILNIKGKPYSNAKTGDTIKFRRYAPFASSGKTPEELVEPRSICFKILVK